MCKEFYLLFVLYLWKIVAGFACTKSSISRYLSARNSFVFTQAEIYALLLVANGIHFFYLKSKYNNEKPL